MRGLNRMPGFPSHRLAAGRDASCFRYYRLAHGEERVRRTMLWKDAGDDGNYVADVYFDDGKGGNAFWEEQVTCSSVYHTDLDTQTWLNSRRTLQGESSSQLQADTCGFYLDIDFKTRRQFNRFGICADFVSKGWRLLGSNDKSKWIEVCYLSPAYIKSTWQWCVKAPKWHVVDLITGRIQPDASDKHLYWGVVFGPRYSCYTATGCSTNTLGIDEIEFNDTVGGTDLCTGGTPVTGVAPSSSHTAYPLSNYFDNNFSNTNYLAVGLSVCYRFPAPVAPQEVEITSGSVQNYSPSDIAIVYSDDGFDWRVKAFFDTFGDWPSQQTVAYAL